MTYIYIYIRIIYIILYIYYICIYVYIYIHYNVIYNLYNVEEYEHITLIHEFGQTSMNRGAAAVLNLHQSKLHLDGIQNTTPMAYGPTSCICL